MRTPARRLSTAYDKALDKYDVISGSHLTADLELQRKIFMELLPEIQKLKFRIKATAKSTRNKLEHENYHILNSTLSMLGMYGIESAVKTIKDAVKHPEQFPRFGILMEEWAKI